MHINAEPALEREKGRKNKRRENKTEREVERRKGISVDFYNSLGEGERTIWEQGWLGQDDTKNAFCPFFALPCQPYKCIYNNILWSFYSLARAPILYFLLQTLVGSDSRDGFTCSGLPIPEAGHPPQ